MTLPQMTRLFMGWDTGTYNVAVAVITEGEGAAGLFFHDCLEILKNKSVEERARLHDKWVADKLQDVLDLMQWPTRIKSIVVGIEDSYLGPSRNVKTTKALSESRGAIRALTTHILHWHPPIYTIAHATAKKALTRSGKATKHGVQQAVLARFFLSTDSRDTIEQYEITEHECDAVAVAVAVRDKWFEPMRERGER